MKFLLSLLLVCSLFSIEAVAAKEKAKKIRKTASDIVVNLATDRTLACSSEDLGNSYEGKLRIRNITSNSNGESFDIVYTINNKNGVTLSSRATEADRKTIAVSGRCTAGQDLNTCYLSHAIDVEEVEDFGRIWISGILEGNMSQQKLSMEHAVGNRPSEKLDAQCSAMPCVIDNFIKTGKLGGNDVHNSCASNCCGSYVDQRNTRFGVEVGSRRLVNDDLTCNVELTESQAEGLALGSNYCLQNGVVRPQGIRSR